MTAASGASCHKTCAAILAATMILSSCTAADISAAPGQTNAALAPDGTSLVAALVPVPFVDEAPQDTEFFVYRASLDAAILSRDAATVSLLASPDIKLSFGELAGRDTFLSLLKGTADSAASPTGEAYWQALETVVRSGGRFESSGRFTAPYYWGAATPADWSPFETYFVGNGPRPVFAEPDATSAIMMTLQNVGLNAPPYQGLPAIPKDGAEDLFRAIRLIDGRVGFMRSADLQSGVGYRAYFEKGPDGWQMTIFLAGD